jgi:hypothetical protein
VKKIKTLQKFKFKASHYLIYKGNSVVSVCDRVVCFAQPCHRFYGRTEWAVQGVTSSSCPWQQKEKKNTAHSLCNFLLLSLATKGKKTLPVPCIISSSCPWQQKENSKQGRAGQ